MSHHDIAEDFKSSFEAEMQKKLSVQKARESQTLLFHFHLPTQIKSHFFPPKNLIKSCSATSNTRPYQFALVP